MKQNRTRRDIITVLVMSGLALSIMVAGLWIRDYLRQPSSTPAVNRTLDVYSVPKTVQTGMTEAQVRQLLGKPHQSDSSKTEAPKGLLPWSRVLHTSARLVYWNPKQEYNVAVVQLENDRVKDVQVKRYPRWLLDFTPLGQTEPQVRKTLGEPSRIISTGSWAPAWVYTDRKASQETMMLQFDQQGKVNSMMLGPNRPDLDGP
ncbi:MAG TPA: hypothetical protein VNA16_06735 [Abditibacteriaceae bacterium]|nr:hypothetical protein [Abditibacteriaceae bacterium]